LDGRGQLVDLAIVRSQDRPIEGYPERGLLLDGVV
jgi:hypothetical protein